MRSMCSIVVVSLGLLSTMALAQGSVGTVFTYQGELRSGGVPANGTFDLQCLLFDGATGAGQVGVTLCANDVEVIDGHFAVTLDFGTVFAGSKRYLEIHVRDDGGTDFAVPGGYQTLMPRQELTATPNAVFASNAATAVNAGTLGGQAGGFYQNAANLTGLLDAARIPGLDASKITTGLLSNARTTGTSSNTPGALVLRDMRGQLLHANIIQATLAGNAFSATNATQLDGRVQSSASAANTIVARDAAGNFSANIIQATLAGNAFSATNATQLDGRVQSSASAANTIVARDSAGNFSANIIQATLAGNAYSATNATQLEGRAPSSASTANTIVARDSAGNFSANIIQATLAGNALSATNATQLEGRVPSSASAANTIVARDSAGNFTANVITATLQGSASFANSAINAKTATNATQLLGMSPSSGAGPNSVVARDLVGNFAANVITATIVGNASSATNATQLQTMLPTAASAPSTIVSRDSSGNFSAGTITAALAGNASSATNASNASQLGGQPAAYYRNADNMNTGIVPEARLGSNIPRLDAANTFLGLPNTFLRLVVGDPTIPAELDVDGRMQLSNGVIRGGSSVITGTSDLGLYSQVPGDWIRFVTNNGHFNWYTDSGMGSVPRMTLTATGTLLVNGNASVSGSLSKGGGSFKIDHPLDPRNKYLYHSFVESPDMMNVYNGIVTLDSLGTAQVTLPEYFEALNRDYRYQLTCVGGFAPVYISQKVQGNAFAIAGGTPGLEVSWQVTGIRHDAWAENNRIPNSVDKVGAERGKLLHPEAFNEPAASGINAPAPATRPGA